MKTFYSYMQKRQGTLVSLFLLMGGHLLAVLQGDASAALTAKANHDHIKIDFFYHGSTVSVRGISDPGVDLIIKITSPEGHQVLKQKGKVGGVLWMNVKTLHFENAPTFYAVHSTKNIGEILTIEEAKKT
jgi:Putative transmembrane protein (Alph_Pro_TM)